MSLCLSACLHMAIVEPKQYLETSCGISSNVVPCGFTYTTVAFVKFCCFFKPKYFWSKLFTFFGKILFDQHFLDKTFLYHFFLEKCSFNNFLFLFELKKSWISKSCILNLESPLLILNHFIVTQKLSLIFLLLRSALIINTWFGLYFFPSLGFINPVL